MAEKPGNGLTELDEGDEVAIQYKRLTKGGEPAAPRREVLRSGRVRANTVGSPTGRGLLQDVEKLVVATSARSDALRVEVWPDGAVKVTKRGVPAETGRLLGWTDRSGSMTTIDWGIIR